MLVLSEVSGWVLSHSARAVTVGVDSDLVPAGGFICTAMDLAMVASTERDGELVADPAAQCSGLRKGQMMGIRRASAAD